MILIKKNCRIQSLVVHLGDLVVRLHVDLLVQHLALLDGGVIVRIQSPLL